MVKSSVSSSSSSCGSSASSVSSLSSFNFSDEAVKSSSSGATLKFLCSYGGKILPRYRDGKLRYVGGHTRVLAVDRSISVSDLLVKMAEMCGWGMQVSLRCQLPTEDLDALVSVTSDEDLANLVEEYDLANRATASPLKIRAFLHPNPPPSADISPPSSAKGKSPLSPFGSGIPSSSHRRISPPSEFSPCHHQHQHHHHHHHQQHNQNHHVGCACHGGAGGITSSSTLSYRHQHQVHLVHNGNHWQ